jgi:hypothetical protein
VDTFHYINHCAEDVLCCTQYNPAPCDSSQPDLVITQVVNSEQIKTCTFNTEAAEQLNTWFGGYKAQLRKMTDYNHNFFVYAMLFFYMRDWEFQKAEAEKSEEKRQRRERLSCQRQVHLNAATNGQDYSSVLESEGEE